MASQFEAKDMLVFSQLDGMNTQSDRHDLDMKKAAWMENLQPIGPNNLLCVFAPAAALVQLTGEVVTKQYYFDFGANVDYVINFCASGAAYAVTNPGATVTKFAPTGTFSISPDATQLGTSRLLIADPKAGYCTWDTFAFVSYGGVSPNIEVTAGGSGYTSPTVVITTSGSGTGATATVQQTGGVVTKITLTDAGTGYKAGDTVTFTIHDGGPGSGATASGHVWPIFNIAFTTLAVFQGRVWLGAGNIVNYTGTGASYGGVGYDDFLTGDAAGSFTINDADLVHSVTALRSLNNYLFIIGDNSVKQIGNISVSGSTTSFTTVTLSSDQGTTFRDTVISFNRLVLFANTVGVYAVFGTSVEKVSDEMDGIFRLIDFSQPLCAAVNDINNIHTFMVLVKYKDPAGTRSIILAFMNKKWFVISQGNSLSFITTGIVDGTTQTFSTSGSDVTEILADSASAVNIKLSTSLTSKEKPFLSKKTIRFAIAQNISQANDLVLLIESERNNQNIPYTVSNLLQFVNNSGDPINFIGADNAPIHFFGSAGFFYTPGNTKGVSGVYIGATLTGNVVGYSFNNLMIEYADTAAFASTGVNV